MAVGLLILPRAPAQVERFDTVSDMQRAVGAELDGHSFAEYSAVLYWSASSGGLLNAPALELAQRMGWTGGALWGPVLVFGTEEGGGTTTVPDVVMDLARSLGIG